MTVLGLSPNSASTANQSSQNGQPQAQHETSEGAKKLAAAALAAAKNAAVVASGRGKVEVNLNRQHHTSFLFINGF
jgi:non-canonical (house-cleaning) NTP pyrophosphatase